MKEETELKTLFAYRNVVNFEDIENWARSQGFIDIVDGLGMHLTITFSKTPFDWSKIDNTWGGIVLSGDPRSVENFGPALVLKVGDDEQNSLHRRFNYFVSNGASTDFPTYQPHITFSYNLATPKPLDKIEPYRGIIVLGPEMYKEINPKYL